MKEIKVTLYIEVTDKATNQDIDDWVGMELAESGSMKMDNPVRDDYEIIDYYWEPEE